MTISILKIDFAWLAMLLWMQVSAQAWPERQLLDLARSAVRSQVVNARPPLPGGATPARPVFVTIEKRGRVLGCRGTLQARSASLEQEVIDAARAAAGHDQRYIPLRPSDLRDFLVTVTIVERLESLSDIDSLERDEGLVLKSGDRAGVVLPWEGRDARLRLRWAYRKAGVAPGSPCRLLRMHAERFRG